MSSEYNNGIDYQKSLDVWAFFTNAARRRLLMINFHRVTVRETLSPTIIIRKKRSLN